MTKNDKSIYLTMTQKEYDIIKTVADKEKRSIQSLLRYMISKLEYEN